MFDSIFKREELPLFSSSEEWETEYSNLMQNEFLSKKYNREKRISDQREYLKKLCPDIFSINSNNLHVVDIGPGPGELLEIARSLGFQIAGYDALIEDCEMGLPYVKLSKMMSDRQKLDIEYCGFENILDRLPLENNSTFLVNSRGSIEQVFKKHLEGPPHKDHHNAKLLKWSLSSDMINDFKRLFIEVERILVPTGYFIIHGNGTSNIEEYNSLMFELVDNVKNLTIDASDNNVIHRIRKT
jgi:SAM-dependent methyltransferase